MESLAWLWIIQFVTLFFLSDLVLEEAGKITPAEAQQEQSATAAPPAAFSGLFSGYHRKPKDSSSSPRIQLSKYLDMCDGQSCLPFWATNRHTLPSLFKMAVRVLAVPASSAPVERVFSHGGVIMRPHRSQLSDKVLSSLIFCKCNSL